ncbi:helix-turn-helix transcriptional regulator [Mangrovicella endophytica]|uniref:helix-turn-helix transcriptional regulator n=1 Tax=Mangrovicella endophytica TaxID=2066697 RepID=UPI0018E47C9D|nr:LuxR family transcriptional regulator [Mangrovicella endophytica]
MSPSEISAEIRRSTADFGVEHLFAGTMPRPGALPSEQSKHVLLADLPPDWVEEYFRGGWLDRDPTIQRVRSLAPSFLWSELESGDDRLMGMAAEHGLKAGLTCSLLTLDNSCAGFSFTGAYMDTSPETRRILHLVSIFAIARALSLRNAAPSPDVGRLSLREMETLRWIAEGKTDWETSMILGVSEKSIEKFVSNARRKLGAINRAHALSIAFRSGIIQ